MNKYLNNFNPNLHNGKIHKKVTEVPDQDGTFYHVGFRHYNDKKDNLNGAKASELKKIFEFLKNVGKCETHQEIIDKVPQEIQPVDNSNHYSKYFSNLTEDVELKEFDVGGLRGFFFFEHPEKRLQLIAIDKHPEYKKQKRH